MKKTTEPAALSSAETTDHEGEIFEDVPDSQLTTDIGRVDNDTATGRRPSSPPAEPTPTTKAPQHPIPQAPEPIHDIPALEKEKREEEDWEIEVEQNLSESDTKASQEPSNSNTRGTLDDSDSRHKLPTANDGDDVPSQTTTSTQPSNMANESTTSKPSPQPSRLTSLSANLPTVSWGTTSTKPSTATSTVPHPPTRKITSPFAWLNRTGSSSKDGKSPPQPSNATFPSRRNTAASNSTVGSNSDLLLQTLDEVADKPALAASENKSANTSILQDQFKALRMQDEADRPSTDTIRETKNGAVTDVSERVNGLGLTGTIADSPAADDKEDSTGISPKQGTGTNVLQNTADENLVSGTVAGLSTATSDAAASIDWDFWQTVVNDGPQAVARASPAELSESIARGIPQTIRGVIWQVLAGSKNEDLEAVYRELLNRGTGPDANKTFTRQEVHANEALTGHGKEKDSVGSSSSSTHSGHSTTATSTNAGLLSPVNHTEKDDQAAAAAIKQAQTAAEQEKKAKNDAAALQKLEKMIKRDMGTRTSYAKYTTATGFQDSLFKVCKAYALFDEGVGYPQGMNFIIMPLLFTMSEEEAFCLLVRLMNQYSLREMFVQDMPGLHLHLYQFERLLEDSEPALYCHLNRRGVHPGLYATQWFLTLFAYRFPLQLVMRVFDLVLSEGLEAAILKFGMAVVQRNVATLLTMDDMAGLTTFLKEKIFDVYIDHAPSNRSILESGFFGHSSGGGGSSGGDNSNEVYRADLLVQDACAVHLTPDMLKRYRGEYEEKTRLEHERQASLDHYRTTIATQSAKVRELEVRAEKSDAEHVQMATDMVRLKVDNQELHDGNESLRGQVEELRKLVENEAATVETRLRAEMDRVMQRNLEVHNDNRVKEESLAEMEADLVATKMKYAEITASHDTLKQKWNDLRKALD